MSSVAGPARRRSIRALLAPIFIVPLLSLLALWGLAASVTLLSALREHNYAAQNNLYGSQAQRLGLELANERSQVYSWLVTGTRPSNGPLLVQRAATDKAVAAFIDRVQSRPGMILSSARPALAKFIGALRGLNMLRGQIDSGDLTAQQAFQSYNAIIDAQFGFYRQLIVVNNSTLYQQSEGSLVAGRAVEMVDREVTLVNGALADRGRMSRGERILFAQTVANQRLLIGDALKELQPKLAARYRSIYKSPAHAAFALIESQIIGSIGQGGRIPVTPAEWNQTSFSFLAGFNQAESSDRMLLASEGTRIGDRLLLQVVLTGGLGLIAVAVSIVLMARFGRRISRELTALQSSALDLATKRLPQVVRELSHGQDVDEATRSAQPMSWRIAEVAKVAEAFASVQSTAVEAAAGQARLRRGASQVFRNLASRSQSLLHRQLALLDRMERSSTDAGTLEELFQLDHLTTRMRRHAEGLIILSGEAPGRGWSQPVPVVDVLRGAIAEVEDYTRVSVVTTSADAVAGTAVADVIHLLAELIDNATVNSPANTEVTVRAEHVANGLAIEVEDRGLGMTDAEMAAANERFANPPEFDLADSDKLGFFVIARLASRQQVKITLRPSAYGGLSAVVLLPPDITVTGAGAAVAGAFGDQLQLTGRDWPSADGPGAGSSTVAIADRGAETVAASDGGRGSAVGSENDQALTARLLQEAGLPQRVPGGSSPLEAASTVRSAGGEAPGMPSSLRDISTDTTEIPNASPIDLPPDMAGVPAAEHEARDVHSAGGVPPRRGVAFGSTPEELGALASSLQRGWLGGRADSADEPDGS